MPGANGQIVFSEIGCADRAPIWTPNFIAGSEFRRCRSRGGVIVCCLAYQNVSLYSKTANPIRTRRNEIALSVRVNSLCRVCLYTSGRLMRALAMEATTVAIAAIAGDSFP